MGILDDFINSIKGQREQYKKEQDSSVQERAARENEAKVKAVREKADKEATREREVMEKAARENEAKIQAAREKAAREQAGKETQGSGILDRMREQRKQFEDAQTKGTDPSQATAQTPTQTIQAPRPPDIISMFGFNFRHAPGEQPHVFTDDAAKAVYIDDIDGYLKSGGKVEQRDITAAMDPYMYNIFTKKGGPIGQARYYKPGSMVISLVSDPFTRYR